MFFQIDQAVFLDFAVHAQRLSLSANDRIHDQTQFIDDPGSLKSAVEDAATFQQKRFDTEVSLQLKKRFFHVDLGIPGKNIGNSHGLQVGQVAQVYIVG